MLLIARFGNPFLDAAEIRAELDGFAQSLNVRIAGISSALELLDEVNQFFFEELRFRGNQLKFLEPENSYLDRVLERRTGIPISLASIFLLVTRSRSGLPFSGASAPGHFWYATMAFPGNPIFIDAFNTGMILRERDIKHYLYSSGLPFHKQFLDPSPPRAILLRMIRNLILAFTEHENPPRVLRSSGSWLSSRPMPRKRRPSCAGWKLREFLVLPILSHRRPAKCRQIDAVQSPHRRTPRDYRRGIRRHARTAIMLAPIGRAWNITSSIPEASSSRL